MNWTAADLISTSGTCLPRGEHTTGSTGDLILSYGVIVAINPQLPGASSLMIARFQEFPSANKIAKPASVGF